METESVKKMRIRAAELLVAERLEKMERSLWQGERFSGWENGNKTASHNGRQLLNKIQAYIDGMQEAMSEFDWAAEYLRDLELEQGYGDAAAS